MHSASPPCLWQMMFIILCTTQIHLYWNQWTPQQVLSWWLVYSSQYTSDTLCYIRNVCVFCLYIIVISISSEISSQIPWCSLTEPKYRLGYIRNDHTMHALITIPICTVWEVGSVDRTATSQTHIPPGPLTSLKHVCRSDECHIDWAKSNPGWWDGQVRTILDVADVFRGFRSPGTGEVTTILRTISDLSCWFVAVVFFASKSQSVCQVMVMSPDKWMNFRLVCQSATSGCQNVGHNYLNKEWTLIFI